MDTTHDPVIQHLIDWAGREASIRAVLLTSTRTNPDAPVDAFSDYDVILAVTDIYPFYREDAWLYEFGEVLVVYRDPIRVEYGCEKFARITQYEDGLKIDFTVQPAEMLPRIAADPVLPDYLDVGYVVLVDKDHLTVGLKPPTFTAFIPIPPDESAYLQVIEEFFNDATYVAKHLWRGHLMPLKFSLDHVMKSQCLRQMLEWRIEIDHNWSIKPGASGKGLKARVQPEIWSALERTYVGAGTEENWEALFATIAVFRRVAVQVADHLGHAYPHDLDRHVVAYVHKVKRLDRQAQTLSSLAER